MIKIYRLKIDGKIYEVELESITEKEGSILSSTPSAQSSPQPTNEATPANGTEVESPMQGSIFEILVSVGDSVQAGDELIILEAMKMENPIVAPVAGVVSKIMVSKGETVDTGKVLIILA